MCSSPHSCLPARISKPFFGLAKRHGHATTPSIASHSDPLCAVGWYAANVCVAVSQNEVEILAGRQECSDEHISSWASPRSPGSPKSEFSLFLFFSFLFFSSLNLTQSGINHAQSLCHTLVFIAALICLPACLLVAAFVEARVLDHH
jgi:hypothetical protein